MNQSSRANHTNRMSQRGMSHIVHIMYRTYNVSHHTYESVIMRISHAFTHTDLECVAQVTSPYHQVCVCVRACMCACVCMRVWVLCAVCKSLTPERERTATHCSTLQQMPTNCNTLQQTATHYNAHFGQVWYRVAKTHRMPYLCRSFSAKEPYN